MRHYLLGLIFPTTILFSGAATAQPSVGYTPIYTNLGNVGGAQLIEVYAPEFECPAGYPNCAFNLSTTLPPGYDPAQVDVFLNRWKINYIGASAHQTKKLNIQVTKMAYNASTGKFDWRVAGALIRDSAVGFRFGVTFTIIMADGTNTFIKRVNPSCSGTLSAGCYSTTTFPDVEPWGTYTQGFVLQGFNLSTSTLIDIAGVNVDVSVNSFGFDPGSQDLSLACNLDSLSNPNQQFTCNASALAISTSQIYLLTPTTLADTGAYQNLGGVQTLSPPPAPHLPFAALQAFDMRFLNPLTSAPEARPIEAAGAACDTPFSNGLGGHHYQWKAYLDGQPYPGSYQQSTLICLDGYLR